MTDHQLAKLYTEYNSRLVTVAQLYVRDRMVAEDIVADSFVKCNAVLQDTPEGMRVEAYLMTIVKNQCLNYLKQKETRSRVESEMMRSLGTLEPEQLFTCELQQLTRKVFWESRYNDKTYQQIAEDLGITHRRVHTEMQRAFSVLREALKDYLPAALLVLYLQILVK